MGPTLGSLYVGKLVERLSASNATQAVFLEFGHDTTIDLALTALGLFKDSQPLSATGPVRANRKFKTSDQVPFGAQMLWERFTCSATGLGAGAPQVRLLLNDAPVPLASCSSGAGKHYGSCSVDAFVKANEKAASVVWGDATWAAACGAQ